MATALQVNLLPAYAVRRQELARAALALALFSIVLLFARITLVEKPRVADSAAIQAWVEELSGAPIRSVHFYDLDATDLAAIKAQLRERGPINDGKSFEARTDWRIRWRWKGLPDGSCGTSNAVARLDLEITLPRLTAAVTPDVAEKWDRYMSALVEHEAGHARIAADHLSAVEAAIRRSSCAEANAAGERELDVIRRRNRQYDVYTRHGAREGVSLH